MTSRPPISHRLIDDDPKPSRVRKSTMGKWRALVLIGVHVLIALHLAHWLTTGATLTPVEPSEAMAFSRSSIVNAGLIFFAVAILSTAVFGRYFCGWGCHLVALQDFCRYLLMKIGITPRPLRSRTLAWVPLLAFIYMFVWPALYRVWIGDSLAIRGSEMVTTEFWATFPGWVVGAMTLLVCGFATVYFLGAKGFCTYACPYGAIFAAADRLAPMRIRVTDACSQCGHCTSVCSSNVIVHQEVRDWGMVVSPGCMKCHDCISVCPKGALYYGFGTIPLFANPRVEPAQRPRMPLRWRDELVLVTAFVLTFYCVRGLYGVVPFLMSLGLAGVFAFLALTSVRLWRQSDVDRPGLRLKRAGKLLPQGRAFVVAMGVLLVFLGHAALLQFHIYRGDRSYAELEAQRRTLLASAGSRAELSASLKADIAAGIADWRAVESIGWVSTLGTAAKLAWLYALSGADADADHYSQLALERGELPGEMHQLRAHLAVRNSNVAAAVSEWQLAIEARPEIPEPYLALGVFQAGMGDMTAALQVFQRGLAAVPNSPELNYNTALALAMSDQAPASVALFERALQLNPRYLEARENLAGVLASLGRFDASVQQFRLAIEQSPNDAQTRLLLVRALLGQGERAQARAELEKLLQIEPDNPEARALNGELSD